MCSDGTPLKIYHNTSQLTVTTQVLYMLFYIVLKGNKETLSRVKSMLSIIKRSPLTIKVFLFITFRNYRVKNAHQDSCSSQHWSSTLLVTIQKYRVGFWIELKLAQAVVNRCENITVQQQLVTLTLEAASRCYSALTNLCHWEVKLRMSELHPF